MNFTRKSFNQLLLISVSSALLMACTSQHADTLDAQTSSSNVGKEFRDVVAAPRTEPAEHPALSCQVSGEAGEGCHPGGRM